MIVIGEKINGTRSQVAKAIAERDKDYIQNLARRQAEAGVDYLDVNAGTKPDLEPDALVWLVRVVQEVVDVPLCLDSVNPKALGAAMEHVEQTPMINSISGEKRRLEGVLPLPSKHSCPVIALALDDRGIPKTTEDRLAIVRQVIHETDKASIAHEKLFVDPLVIAIATDTNSGVNAFESMRQIKKEFPDVHLTSGLSNISFGMPARGLINRAFLSFALEAGLDSAIMDPLDRELYGALLAAEVVLGRDRYCLNYTSAYREGRIGPPKEKR
ncbi:MAG: methyltetrahydrofolate cobalamin methyltransferase [Desulfobacteraceae bacterium]